MVHGGTRAFRDGCELGQFLALKAERSAVRRTGGVEPPPGKVAHPDSGSGRSRWEPGRREVLRAPAGDCRDVRLSG